MMFADEVIPPEQLEEIKEADELKTTKRELDMAKQLVGSLAGDFDPSDYSDTYRQEVLDLIERKAEGKAIAIQPEATEAPEPAPDLMSALKASLEAVEAREGDAAKGRRRKPGGHRQSRARSARQRRSPPPRVPPPNARWGGPGARASPPEQRRAGRTSASRPTGPNATSQARRAGARGRCLGSGASRFVIHEHDATRLHWDLRLERDGVLASWAIPKGLPDAPGDNRLAVWTEDHPIEYLDFAGEIPAGQYGAGRMSIWERGTYECLKWEPRKIEVALHGERLDARYALFPITREPGGREWMIHRMDPPADPDREPMPERIVPMLARSGELPQDGGDWSYEVKWDGLRAIAYSTPGELVLQTRNLNDVTAQYPELSRIGRALGSHAVVLDGEIVAVGPDGRPSFELLQRRMHVTSPAQVKRLASGTPVTYMLFDLLWLDGHSLMDEPYELRRAALAGLALDDVRWRTPEPLQGAPAAVLAATAEQGLEGIIAKRRDSPYRPGQRTPAWVKVKNFLRQEFVVGGWLPGEGRRRDRVGALLVGVHDEDGSLRYCGRVGSGLGEEELRRLGTLLPVLERTGSPFAPGTTAIPRTAIFCEPRLVAEVRFSEWTRTGRLRHPVYLGLREDKPAEEVLREEAPRGTPLALASAAGGQGERHGRRAGAAADEPREAPLPGAGSEQARRDRVRRGGRRGAPRPPPRAGAHGHPLSGRCDGEVLLPEAGPRSPPGVGADGDRHERPQADRLRARRGSGDDRVAGEPRRARASRAPPPRSLSRASHRARLRPRSRCAGNDRGVRSPGPPATGDAREPGPAQLRQDLRLEGPAGVRAVELARLELRAHEALRPRRRGDLRGLPARARRGADDEGASGRAGADRLEPERSQQDDRVRLLAPRHG